MDGRCIILTFILACLACSPCDAQDRNGPALMVTGPGNSAGILVLIDGKVLTGRFLPRPDGYDVQVAGGRLFVESERVRFVAKDLPDAYQRMRGSYAELTPEVHMEMARWCLTNKMTEQARREVLDALNLDPNRGEAQRMLEALMLKESASTSAGSDRPGITQYPSISQLAGPKTESRSLAGLSSTIAQNFTRHIQPLMMNKCANSGCHGGKTQSTFQLVSAHRGSSPSIAEKNLAAVLKQIDLARPSQSAILAVLEEPHGNLNVPLFRGRTGNQQISILRNWVMAAANDIAPDANVEKQEAERQIELVSANVSNDASDQSDQSDIASLGMDPDDSMVPHGRKLSTGETDSRFLKQAARANAQDAFDPSEFNRRFHGRTTSRSENHPAKTNAVADDGPETEPVE